MSAEGSMCPDIVNVPAIVTFDENAPVVVLIAAPSSARAVPPCVEPSWTTTVFLVVSTVILVFIDAGVIDFIVENKWVDLLQLVLIKVIGAYFGGRTMEKVNNNKKNRKDEK